MKASMDQPPTPRKKRSRSAQHGNTNAVKHGFYSRKFREAEISELDASMSAGLVDEIAAIKVTMRRLFEVASDQQEDNLDDLANLLTLMSQTGVKLASMMRTQKMLGGDQDQEIANAVTSALRQVMKGWKIYDGQ
jgi:hypothetical protein